MTKLNENLAQNDLRIYLSNSRSLKLAASLEKMKEAEGVFFVRRIQELPERLHVVYLPGSDKHIALSSEDDAKYVARSVDGSSYSVMVVPPYCSAGFLYRWGTMTFCMEKDVFYGDIDLDSRCGKYSLTIAHDVNEEASEEIVKITLYEKDEAESMVDYFETEKSAVLHLFGERFSHDPSLGTARWFWSGDAWKNWLSRFHEDLSADIRVDINRKIHDFHIVRMWNPWGGCTKTDA